MTKYEFSTTQFKAGMRCKYKNNAYFIKGVDFFEGTIWIGAPNIKKDDWLWLRYNEIDLIKE